MSCKRVRSSSIQLFRNTANTSSFKVSTLCSSHEFRCLVNSVLGATQLAEFALYMSKSNIFTLRIGMYSTVQYSGYIYRFASCTDF